MKKNLKYIALLSVSLLFIFLLYQFPVIWYALRSVSEVKYVTVDVLLRSLAIFSAAALIDLLWLGWDKSALKSLIVVRDRSSQHDFWCWLLFFFRIFDFFVLAFSFGLFYFISRINMGHLNLLSLIPWPWLQIVALSMAFDFKTYCWHRFMHTRIFWELHKFHHSAVTFSLMTSHRVHFLEKGIFNIFNAVLFAIIGAPVSYFTGWMIFVEIYNHLIHSNVGWSFGIFGRYIFISPRAHKIHHSSAAEHSHKNFGAMFNFWDRMFGTFLDTDNPVTVGIENNPYNKRNFILEMADGAKSFGQGVLSVFKKRAPAPAKDYEVLDNP